MTTASFNEVFVTAYLTIVAEADEKTLREFLAIMDAAGDPPMSGHYTSMMDAYLMFHAGAAL